MASPERTSRSRVSWSPRRTRALGALGVLAGTLLVGALALVPSRPPAIGHDSVLDTLFDNRWMIGGTRTFALAVALYVLASIVVRVQRDQWLRHVGPADVETDSIKEVARDQGELQEALDRANETIERLSSEYADLLAARTADEEPTDGAQ